MKVAPWIAAVIILSAGVAAIALSSGHPGASSRPALPSVVRPIMRLIEEGSPIVGIDGTLHEALGIETTNGAFNTVIASGSALPASRILTFSGTQPGQSEFRIHLLRGVSLRAAENHSLGWYRIGMQPESADRTNPVAVIFRVADHRIELSAVDMKTRLSVPLGPADAPEGR
jgi:molecular chaperone DnaK (HSP70)